MKENNKNNNTKEMKIINKVQTSTSKVMHSDFDMNQDIIFLGGASRLLGVCGLMDRMEKGY